MSDGTLGAAYDRRGVEIGCLRARIEKAEALAALARREADEWRDLIARAERAEARRAAVLALCGGYWPTCAEGHEFREKVRAAATGQTP